MSKINWSKLRETLREDLVALPHFLKNPVQGMRELPHWDWPNILIIQSTFALICSVLSHLVDRNWFELVTGIVVGPLRYLILVAFVAAVFYYLAQYFFKRAVPYRDVYMNVLFASIPLLMVTIVNLLAPLLTVVGFAASLMLLDVGFKSNFGFAAKPLRNILIGIMAIEAFLFVYWQTQNQHHHHSLRDAATPQSMDILEKELSQ